MRNLCTGEVKLRVKLVLTDNKLHWWLVYLVTAPTLHVCPHSHKTVEIFFNQVAWLNKMTAIWFYNPFWTNSNHKISTGPCLVFWCQADLWPFHVDILPWTGVPHWLLLSANQNQEFSLLNSFNTFNLSPIYITFTHFHISSNAGATNRDV